MEEEERGRQLVLEALGIDHDPQNAILMVTCRVAGFTFEAKGGDYQMVRGYFSFEPENLKVHVPIYHPGQLVDEAGDVRILGEVFRYIANQLDMEVVGIYNRRLDRETLEQDQKQPPKAGRVTAYGKGVKMDSTPGETETI